jgi:hypothetical protein
MGMDPCASAFEARYPPSTLMTTQDEDDEKAHLLCADGTIFQASKGGKFTSTVLGRSTHELDISVYA